MIEDKLLVWKFNRGSRDALRDIYEKYKDELVTLAAALLFDVSSAEDVVHDVFVSFISSASRFQLTGSLKGYLATCVANGARNRNKTRQRHPNIDQDASDVPACDSCSPHAAAIFGEQSRRLTSALAQLPYEQREVVLLHLHTGLRFKAIAELQGISVNTVQGRYRYALNRLRYKLNGEVNK